LGALSVSTVRPLGRVPVELTRIEQQGNMLELIQHTWFAFRWSFTRCVITCLIRTLEPFQVPSRKRPIQVIFRRETGSVYDLGKIWRALHISLSSWSNPWNASLVGTGIAVRIYTGVEYRSLPKLSEDSRYPGDQRAKPNHRVAGLERSFETLPHEGG